MTSSRWGGVLKGALVLALAAVTSCSGVPDGTSPPGGAGGRGGGGGATSAGGGAGRPVNKGGEGAGEGGAGGTMMAAAGGAGGGGGAAGAPGKVPLAGCLGNTPLDPSIYVCTQALSCPVGPRRLCCGSYVAAEVCSCVAGGSLTCGGSGTCPPCVDGGSAGSDGPD